MARLVLGKLADGSEPEPRVTNGRLSTRRNPTVELREEDAQHRRLDLVEARVVADQLEVDLVTGAVKAEHADAFREFGIIHGHEPAVPDAEEILRRIEAERGGD